MAKRAFYSFHYKPDNWRASQVRNIGVIKGGKPVSDNDWEKVKKGGDASIKKWIKEQLKGKSVVIVLIGKNTSKRKWVKYEIKKAWKQGKSILGIYIHNLKDNDGNKTKKGKNPFKDITVKKQSLSKIVKTYNPPSAKSKKAYNHINDNLSKWIEEAVKIREKNNSKE